MSLSRAITKAVNKATYDPELEKQMAQEKQNAREARTKLRKTLDESSTKMREMVENDELTLQGSTLASSIIQETNKWLQATPDATESELQDKNLEVMDKLSAVYEEDKNRIYFTNWIKKWTIIITTYQTQNKLAEDKVKQIQAILSKEQSWYEKNSNESLETYKSHIDKATEQMNTILSDPGLIQDAQEKLKEQGTNTKTLETLQVKVEAEKKEKEEREKQQFNASRITKKLTGGLTIAFLVALFIAFGLTGASLAANEAVVRPVPYRILFFIFGFLFSIPTILYFVVRTYRGYPPYFASYLLPLYMYDPSKEEHSSFLENLVYYKDNPIIREAAEKFQQAAELSIQRG